MGAAVAVADFDRDGWQDFYVFNSAEGSLNRLYRNRGDGTFEEVAMALGVADVNTAGSGVSMGADGSAYRSCTPVFAPGRWEMSASLSRSLPEKNPSVCTRPSWPVWST